MPADPIDIQRAVQQVDLAWKQRLDSITTDIKLRQWCVEQALKVCVGNPENIPGAARQIHEFLIANSENTQLEFIGKK